MPFDAQFSFTLELAKILPVRTAVTYTADTLIQLVRSLKASGSDFLIEEDLAAIFGRAIIVPALKLGFVRLSRLIQFLPFTMEAKYNLELVPDLQSAEP